MSSSSAVRSIQVPTDVLMDEVKRILADGRSATFIVRGQSMMPFLWSDRDRVTLTPLAEGERPAIGEVILAEVAPRVYVLHRLIAREGERLTLMGDGNLKGVEHCEEADVVGRVTAFYRKDREVPDLPTGRKWRLYSRLWLSVKPVRRLLLAVIRRLPFRV